MAQKGAAELIFAAGVSKKRRSRHGLVGNAVLVTQGTVTANALDGA